MNCQKFEDVVSELARAQMMDADLRTEALEHSADCRQCMLRLSDEETLSRGFGALKREMAPLEASSEIESRLLASFRTPQVVEPAFRNNYARYWLAAVAAVLLIVLGVVAMRVRTDNNPPKQIQATDQRNDSSNQQVANSAAQLDPTVPETIESAKRIAPKKKPVHHLAQGRKNSSTQDQSVAANHVVNEVATEFMPLGYVTAANFQEGGQIVRVELPRSALANFGIPVNMDRYKERVKADVLLGADGLAHAIRFVQ